MIGHATTDLPNSATTGKPYALVVLLQLHWFIRLRWVFAAGTLSALGIESLLFPEVERPFQLLIAVLCVAGVNVVWLVVSRLFRQQFDNAVASQRETIRSGQLFASAQIAVDLLLLTWILSLTGGVENPMSLFYLFHVAIGALLLRTWQAAIQSAWAVVLYATMAVCQMSGVISYHQLLPALPQTDLHAEPRFAMLVVGIVAMAVFCTLYFMDRIGKVLDQREEMLVRANAALEQSRQAIQDLQRRRSRFMQTAAHQLKSPLAMVQTLANLIRDDIVTAPKDIKATCDKIARRCRDGIHQVSELLALARVQEADPRRHQESLSDVGKVVTDLCEKHALVAREKQIEFVWQIPDCKDLVAFVDQVDLVDCVTNLIENAVKYTPDGGKVEVIVLCGSRTPKKDHLPPPRGGTRCVDDYVYVIVKDTGIGIEEKALRVEKGDVRGSLFDAFRRGNSALTAGIPGTGLGLSIVREVVEQAGGYIHVYSRPGHGSTFTVSFPAECGGPSEAVRDTRSSEIVIEKGDLDPARAVDRDEPAAESDAQTPSSAS